MAVESVVTEDRGASGTAAIEIDGSKEYDDAFAEAAQAGEKADLSAADDPANLETEEKPVEENPAVEAVADAAAAAIPPVVEEPVQPEVETLEKMEQRYKSLQGIHRHDKEAWEGEKAALLAQIEEAKKPAAVETPKAPTEAELAAAEKFVDSLTPEQKEQLEAYDSEFDTISKMEGIKRNVALSALRKEIQGWKESIEEKLTAQEATLTPIRTRVEEETQADHFNAIKQGYVGEDGAHVPGHPDYEKYRDDGSVLAWINTYPDYLRTGLKRAYEKGTAAEVIDLFNRFKEANDIHNQPSSGAEVIQLSQKKAQRKAALAAVPGRAGAVSLTQPDLNDFDGAFEEASKRAGG